MLNLILTITWDDIWSFLQVILMFLGIVFVLIIIVSLLIIWFVSRHVEIEHDPLNTIHKSDVRGN